MILSVGLATSSHLGHPSVHPARKEGFSVAISWNTILVGAYFSDDPEVDSGAAYVFTRVIPNLSGWILN